MQNALGDRSRCATPSGINRNSGDRVSGKGSVEFTFTDRLLQRASRLVATEHLAHECLLEKISEARLDHYDRPPQDTRFL
jgi:hypothetical protein